MVSFQHRSDLAVCRDCIAWLASRSGAVDSTPSLPVVDMPATIAFYEAAGFQVRSYDAGLAFVTFNDVSVFDLDLNPAIDPERNGAGCYLIVPDADSWRERMVAAGLPVTAIEDTPWGMREFALTDPNGNRIRIGSNAP